MPAPSQRYISTELTHFVGRGKPEREQYALLEHILKNGLLSHPPHVRGQKSSNAINFGKKLSNNELYNVGMVCFCDIPSSDFSVHMSKYSRFGLAFPKSHLIPKGALPVFYVARNAKLVGAEDERNWGEYLDIAADGTNEMMRHSIKRLMPRVLATVKLPAGKFRDFVGRAVASLINEYPAWLGVSLSTVLHHFLSYVKVFDDRLPEDHIDNFYMEREWRVLGNVEFTLGDVTRIILPKAYAGQLRASFPDYAGQVQFSDE